MVCALLGPGLTWSKTQEELLRAIELAEKAGNHDAAEHIRIILARRNLVMFETPVQRLDSAR